MDSLLIKVSHHMGKMKIKANPEGADFDFSGGDLNVDLHPAHSDIVPIYNYFHSDYHTVHEHPVEVHHDTHDVHVSSGEHHTETRHVEDSDRRGTGACVPSCVSVKMFLISDIHTFIYDLD